MEQRKESKTYTIQLSKDEQKSISEYRTCSDKTDSEIIHLALKFFFSAIEKSKLEMEIGASFI